MRLPRLASAVLAVLLLAAGAASGAEDGKPVLYRWIDENGIPHYTTDLEQVPPALRKRARRLRSETPAASEHERATSGADRWMHSESRPIAPPPPPPIGGGMGASSGPEPDAFPAPAPAAAAGLDQEIAALEAELAAEEERVKALIADPARTGAGALADDPELRDAAVRLPRLQARLRALRAERDAHTGSAPEQP